MKGGVRAWVQFLISCSRFRAPLQRAAVPSGREDERLGLAKAGVDVLQDGDGERGGLARARLRLRNDVALADNLRNRPLLDRRRLLKACGNGARTAWRRIGCSR